MCFFWGTGREPLDHASRRKQFRQSRAPASFRQKLAEANLGDIQQREDKHYASSPAPLDGEALAMNEESENGRATRIVDREKAVRVFSAVITRDV